MNATSIYLKDIVLKSLPNFDISVNIRLSLSIIVNGALIKTIDSEPTNREQNVWIFNDHIEIDNTLPSFIIAIHREITRQRTKRLCSVRISSSRILDQSDLSVQLLSESNAKPLLELTSKVSSPASAITPRRRSTFSPHSAAIHSDPEIQTFLERFYEAVTFMPNTMPIKHEYLTMFAEVWLNRYNTSLDPNSLNMAIITHQDASQCTAGRPVIRFSQLITLGVLLFKRFQRNGNRIDIDQSISTLSYAKSVCYGPGPPPYALLLDLGGAYLARYQRFDNIADLDDSIRILQSIVQLDSTDASQLGALNNLAGALGLRFRLRNDITDLHASISTLTKITTLASEHDKNKHDYIINLGILLRSRYERLQNVEDLNQAISIGQDAMRLTPDNDVNKAALLFDLGISLKARSELSNNLADIDASISIFRRAIQYRNSDKSKCLEALGTLLATRFRQLGEPADRNEAIAALREAMPTTAAEWPVTYIHTLSRLLQTRYTTFGDIADFKESILLSRQVVQLAPDNPRHLQNLASLLLTRYKLQHDISDLNEALSACRKANRLTPLDHPDKSKSLTNVGAFLLQRYQDMGESADLSEAISSFQKALELGSDDNQTLLSNLGAALSLRFERIGNITDINDSISAFQKSIQGTTDGDLHKPSRINNLGAAFSRRFQHLGDGADITNSIAVLREGILLAPDGHEDRAALVSTLSQSLKNRFQSTGNIEDLSCSISILEELFLHSPSHIDAESLHSLGSRLFTRFQRVGNLKDLDGSISNVRQAIQLTGREKYQYCITLGNGLLERFTLFNDASDIDEACESFQKASQFIPDDHPDKPDVLNDLASSYLRRWEKFQRRADLDDAIIILQRNNHCTLDSSTNPASPSLLQLLLGIAMHYRFICDGNLNDIDNSIAVRKSYLDSIDDANSVEASVCLNGIGSSLLSRFNVTRSRADINSSIDAFQRAVEPLPDDHPLKAWLKIHLADACLARFRDNLESKSHCSGHKELSSLLCIPDSAVQIKPVSENLDDFFIEMFGHPEPSLHEDSEVISSISELNAANSPAAAASPTVLKEDETYQRFQPLGPYGDAHRAIAHLSSVACSTMAPSTRFEAASKWVNCAWLSTHPSLFVAQYCVVNLIQHVAWLGVSIDGRHQQLMELRYVARNAVAIALQFDFTNQALEWLEQSRCIVWNQLLQLRTPLDDVRQRDPKRAEELLQISRELEQSTNSLASLAMQGNLFNAEELAQECHRLAEDREHTIGEIRGLDGLEHFLRPPQASYLLEAASEHPIVVLVPNDHSSICLVVKSTNIHHIPLPSLNNHMLEELVHLIQAAVSRLPTNRSLIDLDQTQEKIAILLQEDHGIRMPKRVRSDKLQYSDDAFRHVLRILWEKIVKPVINFLNIQKSGDLPVLQWCPTGLFTFLPIHAAGCYDGDLEMECTSDYFISSYTPTIGALLTHSPVSPTQEFKMMVVIQSEELPATKRELESIQKHVCSDALIKLGVPGTPAHIEGVASHLSSASIVHFACHGKQDRLKPLDSGLVLEDGLLRVSRIIKEQILNGSLAFLCACETTMGDERLPDEAVSLGASLLFSGFRRVVGTMWEMMDEDGPIIADAFYEELFKGPDGTPSLEPDITKSAQALHTAVGKLRSKNVSFRHWVPFIHMGK